MESVQEGTERRVRQHDPIAAPHVRLVSLLGILRRQQRKRCSPHPFNATRSSQPVVVFHQCGRITRVRYRRSKIELQRHAHVAVGLQDEPLEPGVARVLPNDRAQLREARRRHRARATEAKSAHKVLTGHLLEGCC